LDLFEEEQKLVKLVELGRYFGVVLKLGVDIRSRGTLPKWEKNLVRILGF